MITVLTAFIVDFIIGDPSRRPHRPLDQLARTLVL